MRLLAVISFLVASFSSFSHTSELRIASLSPHMTEWLYSLGLGDKIVAVSAYSDYPEAAKEHPVVSDVNGINLAKLIALKPNLIMAWQSNVKLGQVDKLKQLGYQVYVSNPHSINDITREIAQVGELTNTQAAASAYIEEFEKQHSSLVSRYQTRPAQSVFFQLWHAPIMTTNNASMISEVLSICSLENVFGSESAPYPTVNKEQVIYKKPEIIIVSDQTENSQGSQLWQNLTMIPAVANKRIYNVNPDHLHRYTNRVLLAVESLCEQTQKNP